MTPSRWPTPAAYGVLDHEVDELHMVYTDFVSAATQRAEARRIIPLVVEETTERPPEPIPMYIYEPSAQAVLDALLPRYVAARGVHGHAGGGGLRARVQAPGDEGRHRQRLGADRGPDPRVQPGGRPRSPRRSWRSSKAEALQSNGS